MNTAHFKAKEFMCNCGCGQTKPNSELMAVLQLVRLHFNKPVVITSSYRCPKHNKAVGGASKSKHLEGIAADIQVKDIEPMEVYHLLDSIFPNHYGIGSYKTFTHIDVRPTKARW
ncbi:peptidase [Vibrio phage H188]|nr:peptidase [Vibrio phage H188]